MVVTVLCVIMVILAVFLVVAVLMQSGKEPGLSGTIAGGAETFFGKNKGKTVDKALNSATLIVSIIFVGIVLFVYILQSAEANNKLKTTESTTPAVETTETVTETEEEPVETVAPVANGEENETAAAETSEEAPAASSAATENTADQNGNG